MKKWKEKKSKGLKKFCLEKCGKNWKGPHRKQDSPTNRRRTRGHDACHAVIVQLMIGTGFQAPQLFQKKKKKREKLIVFLSSSKKHGRPWNRGAADKPKYMHICSSMYGRRMMNENDLGISLALDKPLGEDKPINPSSMTRHYKVNNEPPYRWGCIFPFKTQQGRYRNNTTIKKTLTARRRENTPIYMSTRNSTRNR